MIGDRTERFLGCASVGGSDFFRRANDLETLTQRLELAASGLTVGVKFGAHRGTATRMDCSNALRMSSVPKWP